MTVEDIIAALGGTGITAAIIAYIGFILKNALLKAMEDLKKQVSPNGGNSIHDLARKALEVSVNTEARVKTLEGKVDAIILSRIP